MKKEKSLDVHAGLGRDILQYAGGGFIVASVLSIIIFTLLNSQ